MPMDPVAQEADGQALEAEQAQEMILSQVPPPTEPLDPSAIGTVVEVATEAFDILSGGQAPLPPVELPTEATELLPPQLAVALATWIAFTNSPEAPPEVAPYALPIDVLASNDGLFELANALAKASGDRKLVRVMSSGGPARQPSPATEAPPATDEVLDV